MSVKELSAMASETERTELEDSSLLFEEPVEEQGPSSYRKVRNGAFFLIGLCCFILLAYLVTNAIDSVSYVASHNMIQRLITDSQFQPPALQVKMASVNFQTPEVAGWDLRAAIFASHLNTFFAGVDIFAMQETKQFGRGGYRWGGNLVVRDIRNKIFGKNWAFIVPTQAFNNDVSPDAQNSDCDVSLFYDATKWQLVSSGSTKTAADAYDFRTVVWGVFRRPGETSLLAVFNTHGPIGHVQFGKNSQFDTIKRAVDEVKIRFLDAHIVIVGDFNQVYNDWNFGHGFDMVKATNGWGGNFHFDWVFSSPYKSGQVTYGNLTRESGICTGADCSTETGSDHEAVLIDLKYESSLHAGLSPQIV